MVTRLEIDTNADQRPDVVQYLDQGQVVQQCQDDDFDGTLDACFRGQEPTAMVADTAAGAPLEALGCGRFHSLWGN